MISSEDKVRFDPATSRSELKQTEGGSVFVSNYPPFSFWKEEEVDSALSALNTAPVADNTLGLYLHIPFCRKRCKFCYYLVHTDKNSEQIDSYLDVLAREVELYSELQSVQGRPLKFVYFGGGTPSYISVNHLEKLVTRLKAAISWEGAEEITFECEPGTLSQSKVEAIRQAGVTRLSLGIQNFDDDILQENGRAHLSKEIYKSLPWIEQVRFDQVNVDLIAGMVGETWATWKDNVKRVIELDPESVTIYQMELPFNTVYVKELRDGGSVHVADWQTKRDWQAYAFSELKSAGYEISSAYTMVKKDKECRFVYRDSVWQGTDVLGAGVASFGHINHVHMQNTASWSQYIETLKAGKLPLNRGYTTNANERLVREAILQMKLGRVSTAYFKQKFDTDIIQHFGQSYEKLRREGMLIFDRETVELTEKGLHQVDQLLPEFYSEAFRNSRYT